MSGLTIYIILSYVYTICGFAYEIYYYDRNLLNFKKRNNIMYILLVIFNLILSPILAPISLAATVYYKISDYFKIKFGDNVK